MDKFPFDTEPWTLENLPFFRRLGFFADLASATDEAVLREIQKRYVEAEGPWLPESELGNGAFGTRSVVEDKDGKFWFCDSLHRYVVDLSDKGGPSFKKEEGIRDAKDPTRPRIVGIISSVVDSAGVLWMATYGDGVWRHDGKDATRYPVKDGDKDITLYAISKDIRGVLWLGTHTAGAYKFNGKTFEKFKP